jgi:hypothetical protein
LAAFQGPYLHFSLIAACFLAFTLYFLIKRLREVFSQLHRKRNPPQPFQPQLLHQAKIGVWVWSIFSILAISILLFAIYLTRFQYISTKVEPAGEASLRNGSIQFTGTDGIKRSFSVKGAQAAAGGIFIRFPSWMSYLGLENYHRLITFRGIGENEYHYKEPPDSWISENSDAVYGFLYRFRKELEFLRIRYTESPYFSGSKRKLFVTHSGYIIQ